MSDDAQDLPTIHLGKKDWPVPEFVWRDTKVMLPKMQRIAKLDPTAISESDMTLLGDIAYLAISRFNGGLTREQFEELPITPWEILKAVPTIIKQADLEATKTGEAPAQADSVGTN